MSDRGNEQLHSRVKSGAKQIEEAVNQGGEIEKQPGVIDFVEALPQQEVLERVRKNESLTPVDVKSFLDNSKRELIVLKKIPKEIKLSIKEGEEGAIERREQLRGVLEKLAIESVVVEGQQFSSDEIWDAVIYDARKEGQEQNSDPGLSLLNDERGEKIKSQAKKIVEEIGIEKSDIIYSLGRAVDAQWIDSLSVNSKRLNRTKMDTPFKFHAKQKIVSPEIDIQPVLVVRKKLQQIDVVEAFLNQRAEGRAGQKKEPKPGEPQIPDQVSWDEHNKQVIVQGVPFSGDDKHLTVVEMLDVLEEGERMFKELTGELLGGNQGRSGWIAEAILRRLNEVWTETSDMKQKAIEQMQTWVSQLGRGHLVAEFLEIPMVGEILSWKDWYQQRDPLTDKPLPMKDLPIIEKEVKEKAKNAGIPSSKVDLALYLSRILQLGYWPGRVGIKHRVFATRYGFEDLGAAIPIEFFKDEEKHLGNMKRGERIDFEAYIADLNATVVGHLTDYAAENLHRVVDNAVTEDILYRMGVADPPIYEVPPDEIIQLISKNQKIPFDQQKQLFEESYLHREQYRWLFVWARIGGLYKGWEHRIGEQASERQYLNPTKEDDRQALINWLNTKEVAKKVLNEVGIRPTWITDEVVKELFTNANMERVNVLREDRGGKVVLSSLTADLALAGRLPENDPRRIRVLATALELVLRDKRTWGVDMGVNNDLLAKPDLPREIRDKGGFASDEIGAMVTMEYSRASIHKTWSTWLKQLSKNRLRNEFPNLKELFAAMTEEYSDETRWRADSLAAPYLPIVTAMGIRSKNMMVGYWLAGNEATAGGMVTSQLHLSDVLDQMRILYWHKPVIGSARRIYGREKHLKWTDHLMKLQRSDLYNTLDTRWEELFRAAPDLNSIVSHLIVGGNGKGMYFHCVKSFDSDEELGAIILRGDPDVPGKDGYWKTRNEREARFLYFPASLMSVTTMESQALQGKLDRDAAKAQIDSLVAAGFMRRWYNNEFEAVGLGDLFKFEFTTYFDDEGRIPQKKVFPIDFMIDLRQQARGVSFEYATARKSEDSTKYASLNPSQFWQEGKLGHLTGDNKALWDEFRKEMLLNWMINVDQPESEMPQFYWEWREQALSMLGLSEEKLEKVPEGGVLRWGFRLKTQSGELLAKATRLLGFGGGWAKEVINENRDLLIQNLQKDPVREELERIEDNFGKFIVGEVREELGRASEKGLFLGEKLHIRKSIEDYYRKGKIDRTTRDMLLNEVIKTPYKSTWKDLKNPDFWINAGWSVPSFVFSLAGGFLENIGMKGLTQKLGFAQLEMILSASPAGYGVALALSSTIPYILKAAVATTTGIGLVGTVWQIFLLVQVSAIVASNVIKAGDWVFKKLNKGRGLSSSDSVVSRKERQGE